MRSNSCLFVLAPLFVCFGAKSTQSTEDEISRKTGSGGGKEGPREDGESNWQSRAEEDGRLEIAVQAKDGQQKEAVREDSQRWVSIHSPNIYIYIYNRLYTGVSDQSIGASLSQLVYNKKYRKEEEKPFYLLSH